MLLTEMLLLPTIFCGILGAIFASFITVIAERIHTGQSWYAGRSRCNSCRRMLGALDLVPVLSWLMTLGRCRTCRSRIPGAYVLGELILGTLFGLSYYTFGPTWHLGAFLLFLVVLFFIVIYDLRHMIVPPLAAFILFLIAAALAYLSATSIVQLEQTIFVAIAIALFFFLMYAISRGRAMGLGDTPVSFALALAAGNQAFSGFLFSFWIGAGIGIIVLVLRRGGPRMGIEIPFVPFLAAGFLLALFTQWNLFI